MIHIHIPGGRNLAIEHVVFDYNGTIATDGYLIDNVGEQLRDLSAHVEIHVVTADTFGRAGDELDGLPCRLAVLPEEEQAAQKARYIEKLGPEHTVAIGNGNNDRLMLERAALGILIIGHEGGAISAMTRADIVTHDPSDAFGLLLSPKRISATLRE